MLSFTCLPGLAIDQASQNNHSCFCNNSLFTYTVFILLEIFVLQAHFENYVGTQILRSELTFVLCGQRIYIHIYESIISGKLFQQHRYICINNLPVVTLQQQDITTVMVHKLTLLIGFTSLILYACLYTFFLRLTNITVLCSFVFCATQYCVKFYYSDFLSYTQGSDENYSDVKL